MSDASFPSLKLGLLFSSLVLASACAPAPADEPDVLTSEAALGEAATIRFDGAFRTSVSGALQKGRRVRVAYDPSRLTACRGDQYGKPAWTITGYWRVGGGEVHTFEAGGLSPSNGTAEPVLALDRSGDLELWFQNTSRWGCSAFDSDFGRNYHFAVAPAAHEPGWLGSPRVALSRQTCGNGGACEGDLRDVSGEIVYDTWVRQRAAIRRFFFEAWKEGVTDRDNPELWKQLDVKVHSRVGSQGPFHEKHVNLDRRTGNNARYGLDLAPLDPLPGMFTMTNKAECPSFALTRSGEHYVEATVEMYFTVNGVELRPADGTTFRVRFQNYAQLFAPCLP
jgi:Family of unknown function (DUF6209)